MLFLWMYVAPAEVTATSNKFGISLDTDPWLECLVAAGMVWRERELDTGTGCLKPAEFRILTGHLFAPGVEGWTGSSNEAQRPSKEKLHSHLRGDRSRGENEQPGSESGAGGVSSLQGAKTDRGEARSPIGDREVSRTYTRAFLREDYTIKLKGREKRGKEKQIPSTDRKSVV